jgi:hypothetical protein
MEKETEKLNPEKDNLELKRTTNYTVAENADNRDTTYWNSVRPIPLSEKEAISIRTHDSLTKRSQLRRRSSIIDSTSIEENSNYSAKDIARHVAFGKTYSLQKQSMTLNFGGLVNIDKIRFNSVDGAVYGTDFRLGKSWEKGARLAIAPSIDWAFARERLLWRVNSTLSYNRSKQARLFIWAGRSSQDFNSLSGIAPSLNMFTSLLFKENYLKLYESNFFTISNRQELVNGLYAEVRYNYEDRRYLDNNTDFSFFKRENTYTENIPVNFYLPDPPDQNARFNLADHQHHDLSLKLSYTPKQRYYLNNGIKSSAGSSYPTFAITWKHGINITPGESGKNFDLLIAEASKSRSIGAFSEFDWRLSTGGFINNKGVEFPDFVHFNSQPLPVLLTNYRDVFMIPGYYSLATPDYFTEFHLRFTTPYLLIKLLPILSNTLMRENLSFAYLYTPHTKNYYELGYAISEVFLLGRFGIYTGFEHFKWKGTVLRFTFIFE